MQKVWGSIAIYVQYGEEFLSLVTHSPWQQMTGVVWSATSNNRSKRWYQRGQRMIYRWITLCSNIGSLRLVYSPVNRESTLVNWPNDWGVIVQSAEQACLDEDYKPVHLHLHYGLHFSHHLKASRLFLIHHIYIKALQNSTKSSGFKSIQSVKIGFIVSTKMPVRVHYGSDFYHHLIVSRYYPYTSHITNWKT